MKKINVNENLNINIKDIQLEKPHPLNFFNINGNVKKELEELVDSLIFSTDVINDLTKSFEESNEIIVGEFKELDSDMKEGIDNGEF